MFSSYDLLVFFPPTVFRVSAWRITPWRPSSSRLAIRTTRTSLGPTMVTKADPNAAAVSNLYTHLILYKPLPYFALSMREKRKAFTSFTLCLHSLLYTALYLYLYLWKKELGIFYFCFHSRHTIPPFPSFCCLSRVRVSFGCSNQCSVTVLALWMAKKILL